MFSQTGRMEGLVFIGNRCGGSVGPIEEECVGPETDKS